jgi:Prokaryotic lipoprotein-attachment site
MKHTLYRFAAILASTMALAACGTTGDLLGLAEPIAQVVETVGNEPTIKSGMTSRDAAYRSNYGAYIKAKTAPRPVFEMEGIDGKPITLTNVKSLKVYAPGSGDDIAQPTAPKSAVVEVMDSAGRFLERVFLPWAIVKENSDLARQRDTNATAVRQTELGVMNGAVTGSQGLASQAITTYAPAEPLVIETAPAASTP